MCFFAVKTSPNRLTVKKYHNQETNEKKIQSSWCSILYYLSQCGLAGLLMCPFIWKSTQINDQSYGVLDRYGITILYK